MDALKVHWFPGHMAKTRRLMQRTLKMVDVVVELLDSRIPQSSRNPEIDKIVNNKPRVIVLNKCDMASPDATSKWIKYFKDLGFTAIALDCRSGKGINNLVPAIKEVLGEVLERRKLKGIEGRPVRMMIVGIPNVGKSSLINRLAGNKKAKVEDRPGVTRGKQWVSLANGVELLDMPGVLWPKIDDEIVGEHLAFVGSVRDQILDIEHMAMRMLQLINENYPKLLQRFKITEDEAKDLDPYDLIELVAKKRGMLLPGGVANMERAAIIVMDEYRGGKMGSLTLEFPPKVEKKKKNLPTVAHLEDEDEQAKTNPECDMYALENKATAEGKKLVCGIDEAGRGPLAGPVVAAAVILNKETPIEGLNDSKKLSEKKRELLFEEIKKKALCYGVGWASVEEIEEHNILQATFIAMRRAYEQMGMDADLVMVDGNRDPIIDAETITVVSGDALSATIGAASILAKVIRDRYMVEMSDTYPEYNFAKHKGYGTKVHREALLQHGASPIHRLSFLTKILAK